ncbi:MAG: substrate-binding domain-containing protein [Ferruginibacter sp.]
MKYLFLISLVGLFSCSSTDKTIKLKGSDTEVNLAVQLAESFHDINPTVFVSVSGGGSGLGIASLFNGTGDMANSSRSINDAEVMLFEKKGLTIDSFIFAQDAIAFVVAESLPIDSISTTDLTEILRGSQTNWSFLTKKKLPINIYGRQSNSGTHDFIKKKLGIDFSPHAKEMNGNAQILEAIKTDNSGIGYVGAGYVIHGGSKGIKVLTIYTEKNKQAVSPLDATMIAAGKYFFQRPLFQYYKTGSYQKNKPFLDFEKSVKGQKIIQSAGYYPVK